MFFLNWLSELWEEIGLLVEGLLRSIFYSICSIVYKMIYYFYNIFMVLCNGQLLESSQLNKLFGRISLLLGVIMLFRVAFSFIQAIIDPESGLSDKEKGIPNVLKKVIIVIVMFGISGYVFDLASDVQALIIKNNVISKFLLPHQVNSNKFGGVLAANLFTAFYSVNPGVDASSFSGKEADCAKDEKYLNVLRKKIADNNDFSYMRGTCLTAKGVYADKNGNPTNDDEFILEFNYIFCLIVGIVVLWFLINYCLSVGVRIVQLTVLQLLAPIAFVGYLEPKSDNMFSKWLKLYISTYLDAFIRMGIISFICYICALIMQGWNDGNGVFWKSVGNPTGFVAKVIGILMILALFQFAKKAPDLLKSIFPVGTSGSALNFGTSKDSFKPLTAATAGFAGGIAGGLSSGVSRAITQRNQTSPGKKRALGMTKGFASGLFLGAGRGAYTAGKNGHLTKGFAAAMEANRSADNKYDELVAEGGSGLGMVGARIADQFGLTHGGKDSRQIARYQKVIDTNKKMQDVADGMSAVKAAKSDWEKAKYRGAPAEDVDNFWKAYKAARKKAITDALKNPNQFTNSEDRSLGAQIKMESEKLTRFFSANNMEIQVQQLDANGNVMKGTDGKPIMITVDQSNYKKYFTTAANYEEASFQASSAQTEIMSAPGYSAAAANANAAGAVGKRSSGDH